MEVFIAIVIGSVCLIAATVLMIHLRERAVSRLSPPGFNATWTVTSCDGVSGLAIDEGAKLICLFSHDCEPDRRVIGYRDLLEVEILEDGHSVTKTSRVSQAGFAMIGHVLFGRTGAVVGALTASTATKGMVTRVDLKVLVNDTDNPVFVLNLMDKKAPSGSLKHREATEKAQEWLGRLRVLMKIADEDDRASQGVGSDRTEALGRADELAKFAKLRDEGVLSDAEFQLEKQRLLGPNTGQRQLASSVR